MSQRDKPLPPKHGRDHRPVGWNGPTDPGGADPINFLSGIRFDTRPQTGGWLHVLTDGSTGYDDDAPGFLGRAGIHLENTGAYGIQLEDSSVQGIRLYSHDSTALADAGVLMFVNESSPGNFRGAWYLKNDPNDNTKVENFGQATRYSWKLQDTGDPSFAFSIQNSANNGIFQVRENGEIHGPVGGSITWDLVP